MFLFTNREEDTMFVSGNVFQVNSYRREPIPSMEHGYIKNKQSIGTSRESHLDGSSFEC